MYYSAGQFDAAVIGAGHAGDLMSCGPEVNSVPRRALPAPALGRGSIPACPPLREVRS